MRRKLSAAFVLLALLMLWLLWGNSALEVNTWVVESEKIPSSFNGFRIAQVSDLHNAGLWKKAAQELEKIQPDIIVLTGDLIDSGRTDVEAALAFAERASDIAPCYFISGNHEAWSPMYWDRLRNGLSRAGVFVMEDEKTELTKGGETVLLMALRDPAFGSDEASVLEALTAGEEGFTILLSHRPERMALYASYGIDLVFSGHAHGGQFRIPFVGGLIAPDQGFFPDYDAGRYELGETVMLVSRGIGNSIIPLRINNRPEILVAELKVSVGFSQ